MARLNTRIAVSGQSLPDAEIPEHRVEQFLDIDPAGDAADGAQRQAQIFREQFGLIAPAPSAHGEAIATPRSAPGDGAAGSGQGVSPFVSSRSATSAVRPQQIGQAFAAFERQRKARPRLRKPGRSLLFQTTRSGVNRRNIPCTDQLPSSSSKHQIARLGLRPAPGARLRPRSRRSVSRRPAVSATCTR